MSAFALRVLGAVESIPCGKVMTYGDIAEYLEAGGPRQVGAVMSGHGGSVPWWRVVNASGMLPPQLRGEAAQRYEQEGTPYDLSRERVNLRLARWDGR
ncbi:MAG: MGMT family protein [Actinocrinis sp.]